MQAGTFHSLCARVLRQDGTAIGIDRRFVIYDTDDQQGLMKQVLRDLELQGTGELRPAAVLGAVSRWKNELIGPAEAADRVVGGGIGHPETVDSASYRGVAG